MKGIAASTTATKEELDALAACLASHDKLIQRRAAEALAELHVAGVQVEGLLLEALRSRDAGRRWGAAFALSLVGPLPAEVRPVLIESMGVDDGDVRWAAADILLRMPGWDSGPEDLRRLLLDGNTHQRKMVAYCLRRLDQRSAKVQTALTIALGDVEVGVRLAALAALSHLAVDHGAAADAIALLVEDRDAGVRRAAAAALGDLVQISPAASAALQSATASDDESLRRAAARSVERLRHRDESRGK
jgi:HEAT repeat protein